MSLFLVRVTVCDLSEVLNAQHPHKPCFLKWTENRLLHESADLFCTTVPYSTCTGTYLQTATPADT